MINFCFNFNLGFLCLVGVASIAGFGVGSAAVFGFSSASGYAAFSGVGSRVGILSKFFIGNRLQLKLFRTFSLALNNKAKLFKKDFFQVFL